MKRALYCLAVLTGFALVVSGAAYAGTVSISGPFERPDAINLTDEGTLDWVHFGYTGDPDAGGTSDYNHKAGEPAAGLISDLSPINGGVLTGGDYVSSISWTDGIPDASAADTHSFVWTSGPDEGPPRVGDGFRFEVEADAGPRVLNVYLGTWNSNGTFTAALSGGESETTTVPLPSPGTMPPNLAEGHLDGFYTVVFSGAGETLTVDWTVAEQFHDWGNAQLVGATLVPEPSTVAMGVFGVVWLACCGWRLRRWNR